MRTISRISMLGAVFLYGCQSSPVTVKSDAGFAPVQAKPTNTLASLLDMEWQVETEPFKPSEDTPLIQIEMRFIGGSPADLQRLGLLGDEAGQPVTIKQLDKLQASLRAEPNVQMVTAPRLEVFDGQKTYIRVGQNFAFVQDIALKRNESGALVPEPIISHLDSGTAVGVQAVVDGDFISFMRFDPRYVRVMTMRDCQANVVTPDGKRMIRWKEPYVLLASAASKDHSKFRLRADEVLVLPLEYQVLQPPAANARAMAWGGRVVETYGENEPETGGQPGALNQQILAIVHAQVVDRPDDTNG